MAINRFVNAIDDWKYHWLAEKSVWTPTAIIGDPRNEKKMSIVWKVYLFSIGFDNFEIIIALWLWGPQFYHGVKNRLLFWSKTSSFQEYGHRPTPPAIN